MSHRRSTLACFALTVAVALTVRGPLSAADPVPVRLLFDTDLESDVDDAGTVAVLHALADRGEVEILAMGVSARHPSSAPCLDALNTYYGRGDVPIGGVKATDKPNPSKYAEGIAKEFPHDLKVGDAFPSATSVYRRALAAQPDGSVVLLTVGFLTNVRDLLASGPDEFSPLAGKELVAKKVRAWVCMGGAFPKGREWNVFRDAAASREAIDGWPAPIVFSGFEIGKRVMTGAGLKDLPADHPVRRGYELYNGLKNRESWDQTAALYAVRGLRGDLDDFWDVRRGGSIVVKPDGSNEWRTDVVRDHAYLVEKLPPEKVAAEIEALMRHVPASRRAGAP